ncbi:MAG: SusD/RagB family nutrient-binding outer membrane lipoprotein [Bacteroidales bacterium]|nr:SusD/RagB family nutrient-binding outer membrane lipoprotein [Bacteroidales bacterium]
MKAMKYLAAFAALCLVGAASCTKNFEQINHNPNRITYGDIQAQNMFEPLIYGIGGKYQENAGYWTNNLIQYTCYVDGAVRYLATYYTLSTGNWTSIWDTYARFGSDAQHMIDLARTEGKESPFYEAVGLILKVQTLYTLTTVFGDIPYKEAYKNILTPVFDSQEDVLNSMVGDLDAATAILATASAPVNAAIDPVYGGAPAKWIKFANSLRMRILCLETGINESYWGEIQKMIDSPATYPVFTSNSDNAKVPFQEVDPYKSSMGPTAVASFFDAYSMTEQMIKMMNIQNEDGNDIYQDPRLVIFASQKGGKWTGAVAGCLLTEISNEKAKKPAQMNERVLWRDAMDSFLMDWSEILFIEAEGILAGKLTVPGQTAKALYEAAVTANIQKWAPYITYNKKYREINAAAINEFLASDLASYDKAVEGTGLYKSAEELVLSQKWLSLYWVGGFEPYTHWRHYEYPVLTIGDGTEANGFELPTRFGYPNYTESSNGKNVAAALQRMGGKNDMHLALDWSYKKNHGSSRNPHPQYKPQ